MPEKRGQRKRLAPPAKREFVYRNKPGGGRPSLPPEQRVKYHAVNLREDLYDRVKAASLRCRRPMSELMQYGALYVLAHEEKYIKPPDPDDLYENVIERISAPLSGHEIEDEF